ncbi:gamma-glutamyl-gamma-aminobutyraldehyde dehydrogenase [Pseudomonas putida]|uniref:aldehyde dehydrogenase n=1 Tax=unclassified Pseudomonas TaxID=196821 RepID=UPI000AE65646|nr:MULTISPECIES: aldehyde dehydrogenase [unclassified Pseudomonas]GLO29212.1 gamma-glutamyl-gamma-aminobutyraldehyde dehydrogenase [Pseudomonas putida]
MSLASFIDLTTVQQRASKLQLLGQAFIDGRFVDALSGETFANISPRDGRVLNQVASCQAEDVEMAVKAARRAFDSGVWSQRTPKERKRVMLRFAALFEQHMEELALLETLDMGKPISESAGFDVHAVLDCLQWYAESCDKLYDEVAPSGPSAVGLVTREAIGVVAAVTPWNFPMLMAMWKVAPALAMGNSVVLKPAEQSPLTALRIAQLAAEAGIPAGVFNVLPGFGPTAGKALGLHMDVDTLVFTGSGEVGKLFLQYAGQSNMKRVWLECGGKTPNIILDDCRDLEKAATTAARSMFFNQGEVCVAPSRLIVEAGIRAEFVAEVLKVARTIAVGDPLDPTTQLGAIVDASQLQRVLGYIDKGVQEGAQLILGGERVKHGLGAEGFYIPPTIFDNVSNDMTIAREEIFGPVLSVITARDHLDALRIANDTPYGLAASLWTRDLSRAHQMARGLRAGSVWVNCFDGGDISMPFGGFKQSGNGRDRSLHALDKYSELKSTWIEL